MMVSSDYSILLFSDSFRSHIVKQNFPFIFRMSLEDYRSLHELLHGLLETDHRCSNVSNLITRVSEPHGSGYNYKTVPTPTSEFKK